MLGAACSMESSAVLGGGTRASSMTYLALPDSVLHAYSLYTQKQTAYFPL